MASAQREPTNIERFLAVTTPKVRNSQLGQLWDFYDVPYGVEVPYFDAQGTVRPHACSHA